MTVAKVTAGRADDYAEYLEAKSEPEGLGDYYLKDGDRVQAPGRWADGAGVVGCDPEGPVSAQVLRALMEVRRPDTGEPLRLAGASGVAVAAIDATFSAPKSVSAVWALASPALRQRIERAHELAIDRALAHSIRYVAMIRERVDQYTVIHAKPERLIATSWRHTTARSVGGQPPDPQLHSHVLLHAAVRGDGRVVAVDSRSWLVHRRELGAAYRTELARLLAQLGFGIRRGTGRAGRYFELHGVPEGLVDRWSSRHHQVRRAISARVAVRQQALVAVIAGGGPESELASRELAELQRSAQLSPKLDRSLTATSRAGKGRVRSSHDLDRHWRKTAHQHRFDAGIVERLRTSARTIPPATDRELLQRLTEFDARFKDREARAVALEASTGTRVELALGRLERLRVQGQLLQLADQTKTTRAHRSAERDTVAVARRLAHGRVTAIPRQLLDREASELDARLRASGGRLVREQRVALELCCADRQLVVIEGQAGSGKSTILAAVARAHHSTGREIIVTSTGALAAERLARELQAAGASNRAYSLAALGVAIKTGSLTLDEHSTVIHEEAALASTREQQQLLQAVGDAGARLIAVGDPQQSHPVGAGGLWARLEQTASTNRGHAQLQHNVRAREPADQHDQRLFREHESEAALRSYAQRDRVHTAEDPRQVEDLALEQAHADRQGGKRTLVLAQATNEHLDELNARAQAIRHQAGELGRHSADLPGRPYKLHAGDEIQIRRTTPHPELGALRNGTTAHITNVARDGQRINLRLPDDRDVHLDRAQIDQGDIRLAYVQHPFPAQGQTTDTAHLIISDLATHQGSYVALTRAREQTHIYGAIDELELADGQDRLSALAEQMSRSERETPSIDTPLAHEAAIEAEQQLELDQPQHEPSDAREVGAEPSLGWEP
ncbi:MAG: relaxase domain-containing protein [Solirubrobacterales bacterium]|nr:relaxase domain-containing protein [Solirubrobacterales bacterium]MBV9471524.1 relaxase domain-containing protein [Solirubrobacterales bacterium]